MELTDQHKILIKPSSYVYSDDLVIREWNGGKIWLNVGYVREHPEKNQITLFKRYSAAGGQQTVKFNIKGEEDWNSIRAAVEKLWPELGDGASPDDLEEAVHKVSREMELLDLVAKYPEVLNNVPSDIDIFTLPDDQKNALRKLLAVGGAVAQSVIQKLCEQPYEDLEGFVRILEELRLSTVNSLVSHVTSRLGFIDKFEQVILDDKSYERRGEDSVHNLLRANIWILDRNYSVLHDDETLKNIIYKEFHEEVGAGEPGSTRPDFLCMASKRAAGTVIPNKLVIIEIKRPSVTLNMDHITQLMGYKDVLDRYSGDHIESFDCYLIGRERNQLLRSNDLSKSGYRVKTYTDFIREAREFYEEYLKIISDEKLSI